MAPFYFKKSYQISASKYEAFSKQSTFNIGGTYGGIGAVFGMGSTKTRVSNASGQYVFEVELVGSKSTKWATATTPMQETINLTVVKCNGNEYILNTEEMTILLQFLEKY